MPPKKRTIIESSPEADDSSDERPSAKSARSTLSTRSTRNTNASKDASLPSTPTKARSTRSGSVTSTTSRATTTPKKIPKNLIIDMKMPALTSRRIPAKPVESPRKKLPVTTKISTPTAKTTTKPTAKATKATPVTKTTTRTTSLPVKKTVPVVSKKAKAAVAALSAKKKAQAAKKKSSVAVEEEEEDDEELVSGEDDGEASSKEEVESPARSEAEEDESEADSDHAMDVDEPDSPDTIEDDSWVYTDLLDSEDDQEPELEHVIRAHSRSTHEGQDETETDTWAVAFQPTLPVIRSHGQGGLHSLRAAARQNINKKSSNLVATCGGNTICLIDCRLGKVVVKYSHVEEEEFMSLAWTTLDHYADGASQANGSDEVNPSKNDKKATAKKPATVKGKSPAESKEEDSSSMTLEGGHSQANILAAGGRLGSIKLINPTQNTCYKYLHGHTDAILRLKFSLTNPRWLFSASSDGSARLWDIGSLTGYETEACCLAKFGGLGTEATSVTAIGVSEKYLIVGTDRGMMARYNLFKLNKILDKRTTGTAIVHVEPDRIFPNSQEWHESSVDDILYIPYFSAQSYAVRKANGTLSTAAKKRTTEKKKSQTLHKSGKTEKKKKAVAVKGKKTSAVDAEKRGRGRSKKAETPESESEESDEEEDEESDESDSDEDADEGEFVFASREDSQGEIIVWDASKSTAEDAEIKTILEWSIAESWAKFALAENFIPSSLLPSSPPTATAARGRGRGRGSRGRGRGGRGASQANERGDESSTDTSTWASWATKRRNTLVAGSTDGKIVLYDLGIRPKLSKGNVVAQKPARVISHPESKELFRDVAVSQDLRTIVAGDWNNRVFVWHRDTV